MKEIITSVIFAVVLVLGTYALTKGNQRGEMNTPIDNVSVVEGKQIIEIKAKGGYFPQKSVAKAGMHTVLRFDTNGTFDCSSSVRIPSMDISKALPSSGVTDIDIGSQGALVLQGTCGMGMYPFEVEFKNS